MEEGYDDNEGGSRGGGRKGQGERQGPYGGGGSHRERGPGGQPREDRGQATRCSRRRRAPRVVVGGGEGWWGICIRHRQLIVLVLQSAVAILGMNVSLYILNNHSRLHFRHSRRFRMLAPHQYKQVFAVELVSFAFHIVLNHFCAQS